ncbi:GTP pyrophosphokinase [Falsochrobactrum sp. TDYN1]|uniref:GTP pyrophosphokinase n=1 Tax=Falsochrobactrum tianjinense TaxID=2706015 RepID=A0A949PNF2_9HYPH|nr:GTP pyrophosphokinase [Falsochrobactrum sp. TDYN1]MBV2143096.1 GTP pyrophosphokinase [Falsochrobactrum sp. TDYN1]
MSNIETAIAVAAAAHMGQVDKNGEPYILHPIRVMLAQTTSETQIVGVMHDMIEDTNTSLNDIYSFGFDDDIVLAMSAITRRDDEDYFVYVARACSNPIARPVKIADLRDNLRASNDDDSRRARYLKALELVGEKP